MAYLQIQWVTLNFREVISVVEISLYSCDDFVCEARGKMTNRMLLGGVKVQEEKNRGKQRKKRKEGREEVKLGSGIEQHHLSEIKVLLSPL